MSLSRQDRGLLREFSPTFQVRHLLDKALLDEGGLTKEEALDVLAGILSPKQFVEALFSYTCHDNSLPRRVEGDSITYAK